MADIKGPIQEALNAAREAGFVTAEVEAALPWYLTLGEGAARPGRLPPASGLPAVPEEAQEEAAPAAVSAPEPMGLGAGAGPKGGQGKPRRAGTEPSGSSAAARQGTCMTPTPKTSTNWPYGAAESSRRPGRPAGGSADAQWWTQGASSSEQPGVWGAQETQTGQGSGATWRARGTQDVRRPTTVAARRGGRGPSLRASLLDLVDYHGIYLVVHYWLLS